MLDIMERYRGPDDEQGNPSPIIEDLCQYEYDSLYRLTRESRQLPESDKTYWIEYTYDAFGNRLEMNTGGVITTYTCDKNDRFWEELGPTGVTTYAWDDNGNMIAKTSPDEDWVYEWTFDNKMAVAQKNGSFEASYSYDFRGERINKDTAADSTSFLIDNNNQTGYSQALREVDSNNEEQVAYTFGDDLISQSREDVSYLHYDGLGSTRALTSASAIATDTFSYLAFGAILNRTGSTPLTHLFTGEAYDFNLSYYYLRARLYNPQTGRFASLDPFSGFNSDPRSLHKYVYAHHNPMDFIDPSGMFVMWKAVALLIIAILISITALRYYADYSKYKIFATTLSTTKGGGGLLATGTGNKETMRELIFSTGSCWCIIEYKPANIAAKFIRDSYIEVRDKVFSKYGDELVYSISFQKACVTTCYEDCYKPIVEEGKLSENWGDPVPYKNYIDYIFTHVTDYIGELKVNKKARQGDFKVTENWSQLYNERSGGEN